MFRSKKSMVNRVEVAFEIPFYSPRWRSAQKNCLERRVAASSGTKVVRACAEQWLIQGFQDELDRALHHFIFGRRDGDFILLQLRYLLRLTTHSRLTFRTPPLRLGVEPDFIPASRIEGQSLPWGKCCSPFTSAVGNCAPHPTLSYPESGTLLSGSSSLGVQWM